MIQKPSLSFIQGDSQNGHCKHQEAVMLYEERSYQCSIEFILPSRRHALQIKQILQVDREISYQDVYKLFTIVENPTAKMDHSSQNLNTTCTAVLKVSFYSTQAKLLRVSVSSFYDYLIVALKCYQEFEH
jgi:Transcription factor Pcc1